jgi:hypothetical protein
MCPFFGSYSFLWWCIAAFKMVITFLAFSRRLFTVSICPHRVISSSPSNGTNCSRHLPTCLNQLHYNRKYFHHEDWRNIFLRNAGMHLQICVVSQHYNQQQNILQNRQTSLSGQWKREGAVARFEITSAVLHKHINPGKETFRVSKDCDIKQAPWSASCLSHRTRISCLRVIELYTSSEDGEVHCVVAVLIPLIRNP